MNKDYIYKRRLLKLANFLEKLPPERFGFATWVGYNWEGKANLSCGTTACALGWASTIPSFRKLGLRLFKINEYTVAGGGVVALKEATLADREQAWNATLAATNKIFGLNRIQTEWLFTPDLCNGLSRSSSAQEVASHIRNFVENWTDNPTL